MSIVLKGENLVKRYGTYGNVVCAINDINIEIEEGSFVVILGKSGSGKSTMLHMLGGLVPPSSGEVLFKDQKLYHLSDKNLTILRRRNFGFIFQFFNLVTTQNVIENICLTLDLDHKKPDMPYIDEIIELLGLTEKKYKFVYELSGGQQQRVAIARALASKPAVIFADEPTGNLDSESSKEVLDLLKLCQQRYHQTILMVTHDESMAQYASRVIRIADGKIVSDTTN